MTPAELKTLLDAATPGPWRWECGPCGEPQLEGNVDMSDMAPILVASGCRCDTKTTDGVRGCGAWGLGKVDPLRNCPLHPIKADRDFISTARTLLPPLVRLWEAAERAVADDATCGTDERPCLMELTDIIAELRDTKGTP